MEAVSLQGRTGSLSGSKEVPTSGWRPSLMVRNRVGTRDKVRAWCMFGFV